MEIISVIIPLVMRKLQPITGLKFSLMILISVMLNEISFVVILRQIEYLKLTYCDNRGEYIKNKMFTYVKRLKNISINNVS